VVPEFLGNRSPFAEPDARALIAGIGLDSTIDDLVSLYVAGLCGIGYGLKQLLNVLDQNGINIETLVVSGGAGQSQLVRQVLADSTNVIVAAPETSEPVLLGAAMLAASASKYFPSLEMCMQHMSAPSEIYHPTQQNIVKAHVRRFRNFETLQLAGRRLREKD